MIYLARSKQRRDCITRQIRDSLSKADDAGAAGAGAPGEPQATARQRFAYQLPAWLPIIAFAAIPTGALVYMRDR